MGEINDLKDMMRRLLGLTEDLSMWSGALNPVISMLLERMGDSDTDFIRSQNVESWLDLAE